MPTTLPGASRTDALRYEGAEIAALAESPQIGRFEPLDQDHVRNLAERIAREGQNTPGLVRRGSDGRGELVAGRHRKAAILLINQNPGAFIGPTGAPLTKPLPFKVVYREMDDRDAARASFAENTGLPLTVMDLAQSAHNFSKLDWSNEEIAAVMSTVHHPITPARVSALRQLIRLPHKTQQAVHHGRIPESAAQALLDLKVNGAEALALTEELVSKQITAVQLKARAKAKARQNGKQLKRSLGELRAALLEHDSMGSLNLLAYLDGELNDLNNIFQDD